MRERVIPEAIATFGASIAFCIFISVRGGERPESLCG